jgi:uncharacterized protein YydD (DUF2326 family)
MRLFGQKARVLARRMDLNSMRQLPELSTEIARQLYGSMIRIGTNQSGELWRTVSTVVHRGKPIEIGRRIPDTSSTGNSHGYSIESVKDAEHR